jgi:hypothetical protein
MASIWDAIQSMHFQSNMLPLGAGHACDFEETCFKSRTKRLKPVALSLLRPEWRAGRLAPLHFLCVHIAAYFLGTVGSQDVPHIKGGSEE